MLSKEQIKVAKEMLESEVKAYFDVRDELGLSEEQYYELIRLDVNEWRIRARGKNVTPSRVMEEIDKRLLEGNEMNFYTVARELRALPRAVVELYRKRGYRVEKEPLDRRNNLYRTPEIDKKVCRLYDQGLVASLILIEMEYIFRTQKSIVDILKDYGRTSENLRSQELHMNAHIFDFIDTEEKAYWLGMLMTDGWIHRKVPKKETQSVVYQVGLSLQKSDWYLLENFKEFVGSQRAIVIKRNQLQSGEWREYGSIIIDSKIMFGDLQRYGVIERKSSKTEPNIELIPRALQRHFWRGAFDGDGSLYFGSANNLTVSYVGNIDIVYKLVANLYHNQIVDHFRTPVLQDKSRDIANGINATIDVYSFKYADKIDVYNILEYLYEGASIYMRRKYQFWVELNDN